MTSDATDRPVADPRPITERLRDEPDWHPIFALLRLAGIRDTVFMDRMADVTPADQIAISAETFSHIRHRRRPASAALMLRAHAALLLIGLVKQPSGEPYAIHELFRDQTVQRRDAAVVPLPLLMIDVATDPSVMHLTPTGQNHAQPTTLTVSPLTITAEAAARGGAHID